MKKTITREFEVEFDMTDLLDGMLKQDIVQEILDIDTELADWEFTISLLIGMTQIVCDIGNEINKTSKYGGLESQAKELIESLKTAIDILES